MKRLRLLLILALVCSSVADAAPRRRAVRHPGVADASPETWLRTHAYPLHTAELVPFDDDLEPLRSIVGDAGVVALGEATHGTREFHTMRMRMIDFMVREMGFDVVVMEAPFPLLNRVNVYVQGGAEDPHSILAHAFDLGYYFWEVREMLDLFEWARTYNATRGERPPLEFAGADTYDHQNAARAVVSYLQPLDPAFAAQTEAEYSCVFANQVGSACWSMAFSVHGNLAEREEELETRSSPRAFDDALHHATVVMQYLRGGRFGERRDQYMAENTLWLREHRGQSRRVLVWAHQEHVGKTPIQWINDQISMGGRLESAIGDDYVVIGTTTRTGDYLQWNAQSVSTNTFTPETATGYEAFFARGGAPILLIPLQGSVPSWLHGPETLHSAPANPSATKTVTTSLPDKFDAIVYFETTTAATAR